MRTSRRAWPIAAVALLALASPGLARAQDEGPTPLPDFFAPAPAEPLKPAPEPVHRPPEAPGPVFGSRGQVVINGGSNIYASSTEYSGSQAGYLALVFSPGVDYFFVRNVSIGLSVDLEYTSGQGYGADSSLVHTRTVTVAGGPRFGVNVPLGRSLSLWPLLTLAVESVHRDVTLVMGSSASVAGSIAAPSTTLVGPSVNLYVPLLLQVAPHFYVGAGPSFFHEFGRAQGGPDVGGERTYVGAGLVVGGHVGGAEPAPGTLSGDAPAPRRRFGQARDVALTNEEVFHGGYTSYSGTGASVAFFSAALGVDYFFVDRISIGFVVGGDYTHQVGPDATGVTVTNVRRNLALGPRLGLDVPLGPWLSIFPRATITFGPGAEDETSRKSANDSTNFGVTLSLAVPLLLHPVSHFFAGFGPYLAQDLLRQYTFPNGATVANSGTTLGGTLLLGGWL